MRVLAVFFLFVLAFGSVDKQIEQTNHQLKNFSKNYRILNKKMAKTAKEILQQKKEVLKQQKLIKQLEDELKSKQDSYTQSKQQLKELVSQIKKLKTKKENLENELVFAIAKSLTLSVILSNDQIQNIDSIVELEILKNKLKEYKSMIKQLDKKYITTSKHIDTITKEAVALNKSIKKIDKKKKKLLAVYKQNQKSLKKLKLAKASYKKSLKKLLKKQYELKKTLAKLNIIKINEQKLKQQEKERKQAFARKEMLKKQKLPKVKKKGSSFVKVNTVRYKGPKTIPPIDRYTITKKYGTYTDPIYGIKVFNESISLKPKKPNARVKNVLNGKVVYADKTAILDNVVVIEHKNGLHTIYANLSQIAPNIKKGKKIKKGYTIGRVSDELIFEVTKKSSHINPVRLFR